MDQKLPLKSFENVKKLRIWLEQNSTTSKGLQVHLYKTKSNIPSIAFHDLLEEGLCFGWSESKRYSYDEESYIQMFTPRKKKGTNSPRNKLLIEKLIKEGRMTNQGFNVL